MSLTTMSSGDRLRMSRKGRTGGGWLVHPKGANSMAVSGVRFKLVGLVLGGSFSCPRKN